MIAQSLDKFKVQKLVIQIELPHLWFEWCVDEDCEAALRHGLLCDPCQVEDPESFINSTYLLAFL